MKLTRYIFLCVMLLCSLSVYAQKEQRAKEKLDKTSSGLSHDSGIKATFLLKNYRQKELSGQTEGSISLKGKCFILKTNGITTWFNGKTQWTYVEENEEINISNPTEEELQSINPYSFINLYKKGFNYALQGESSHKGKAVYKILLTPEDKTQDITQITLQIEQKSYQPVTIQVKSKKGEEMNVEVLSYSSKQNLPDSSYT